MITELTPARLRVLACRDSTPSPLSPQLLPAGLALPALAPALAVAPKPGLAARAVRRRPCPVRHRPVASRHLGRPVVGTGEGPQYVKHRPSRGARAVVFYHTTALAGAVSRRGRTHEPGS